ncbi:hypothetical protein [Gellertiella hungarica]|uniref:Uncharacterized protein n=1 Tax=Gellertiella hungarica TaxID=1572859 RepID=A0A7W6J8H2_9HYPH|nr:hypothetical protein [Gellertiella hungarica]MBB4066746.1 hypothetical protein [Gellertiella hungarica]
MADEVANPVRLAELPEETRLFLAEMRGEDLQTLKDGLRLVIAIRTVGTFMKWMIVGTVGLFVGFVMVWENILKFLAFFGPHK